MGVQLARCASYGCEAGWVCVVWVCSWLGVRRMGVHLASCASYTTHTQPAAHP